MDLCCSRNNNPATSDSVRRLRLSLGGNSGSKSSNTGADPISATPLLEELELLTEDELTLDTLEELTLDELIELELEELAELTLETLEELELGELTEDRLLEELDELTELTLEELLELTELTLDELLELTLETLDGDELLIELTELTEDELRELTEEELAELTELLLLDEDEESSAPKFQLILSPLSVQDPAEASISVNPPSASENATAPAPLAVAAPVTCRFQAAFALNVCALNVQAPPTTQVIPFIASAAVSMSQSVASVNAPLVSIVAPGDPPPGSNLPVPESV